MPLVFSITSAARTFKVGAVWKYDPARGIGTIRHGQEVTRFRESKYCIPLTSGDTRGEPRLDPSTPPRTPTSQDLIMFWSPEVKGRDHEATAWTFADLWNPAMVQSLINKECIEVAERRERLGPDYDGFAENDRDDGAGIYIPA